MKYNIIFSDEEIENMLNIRYKKMTLQEIIKDLENKYKDFDLKKSKKSQLIFNIVTSVSGKIENNPKNLTCPNCNGKYVVRTYVGDLYYRLFNGTKQQKEQEKKRFEKMGLYSNPCATGDKYTRKYWCLSCNVRWNGKDKDIIEYL